MDIFKDIFKTIFMKYSTESCQLQVRKVSGTVCNICVILGTKLT